MISKESAIYELNSLKDYILTRETKEALDMAISALEKQIAKKPRIDYNGVIHKEHCPNCNRSLFPNEHHCECGQRIDLDEGDTE